MPSPSGVDLRANVESKRDALCRLFQDYDHGRVGADGLQAGLARLDVFATRAYLLALSKPPLRLATFLHALTVPDSTRFKLDGADPMNFVKRLGSIDTVAEKSHERPSVTRYRGTVENRGSYANRQDVRVTIQTMFRDLKQGAISGDAVRNALIDMGFEITPTRSRLINACERGSACGFRDLSMEFGEPRLSVVADECRSEAADREARRHAGEPDVAPTATRPSRTRYVECRGNAGAGNPNGWVEPHDDDPPVRNVGRRHCYDALQRGSLMNDRMLVPRRLQNGEVYRSPGHAPARPAQYDDLVQPNMIVRESVPAPITLAHSEPAEDVDEGPRRWRRRRPGPPFQLQVPWGTERDVDPLGAVQRPFAPQLRRFEMLAAQAGREIAQLDAAMSQRA
ncbi:unnamed protein product (mitochondrion) [Plasmodiophora brassicae]|uniref:Uncharacterized protein n=1 Tax=Plasmodiophora brassicae TaxID=37360 RepID=A0A0G4IQ15_PLABS|nr:hypothetical protein PBRA_000586 [Plasmodiophora brassicae]SPQ97549.1 unnamed protein product [Plasmodiophora brassicae]